MRLIVTGPWVGVEGFESKGLKLIIWDDHRNAVRVVGCVAERIKKQCIFEHIKPSYISS